METSQEIKERMKQIYTMMEQGDAEAIKTVFSSHSGVRAIGTDPNEWWQGGEQITSVFLKQLEEMKGISIVKSNPEAFNSGATGWAADNAVFKLGDIKIPMRVTAVFNKEQNDWKVVQWHTSMGVSNEEAIGKELSME